MHSFDRPTHCQSWSEAPEGALLPGLPVHQVLRTLPPAVHSGPAQLWDAFPTGTAAPAAVDAVTHPTGPQPVQQLLARRVAGSSAAMERGLGCLQPSTL